MKATYILHEEQSVNTTEINMVVWSTVKGAKNISTREQRFNNSTMKITDTEGYMVASKAPEGKWVEYEKGTVKYCDRLIDMMS